MTATVLDFEVELSRRMVARERAKAEAEAQRQAARAVAADEATAGAQLEAMWTTALSRHADPTAAAMLWAADLLDEVLEADTLEAAKVAALQLANGARMVALARARRTR